MIVRLSRRFTERAESRVHSQAAVLPHGGATKRLWVFGIGLLAILSFPIALHAQEPDDTLQAILCGLLRRGVPVIHFGHTVERYRYG